MAPRCCRGLDRVGLPDELPRPFASRVSSLNNRAGAAWRLRLFSWRPKWLAWLLILGGRSHWLTETVRGTIPWT